MWKSAVFLGVLAQVGAHVLYLCGILHHRLFRGLEHVVAVVGHGLTQRARLALGSGGDLGGALLGGAKLRDACVKAGEFVRDTIAYTAQQGTDPNFGVQFEKLLPYLWQK